MSDFGSARLENELDALADEHPHLREHLEWFHEEYGEYPKLIDEPSEEGNRTGRTSSTKPKHRSSVTSTAIWGSTPLYYCVEPTLEDEDKALYDRIRQRILDKSVTRPAPGDNEEFEEHLDELLDEVVEITSGITGQSIGRLKSFGTSKVSLAGSVHPVALPAPARHRRPGPLEPVMARHGQRGHPRHRSEAVLPRSRHVRHDLGHRRLRTPEEFEQWLRNMGERMNHPISDSDPIIDATLPGGSRINIIYSDDVSVQGPR